jgi:hypothetical protein
MLEISPPVTVVISILLPEDIDSSHPYFRQGGSVGTHSAIFNIAPPRSFAQVSIGLQ